MFKLNEELADVKVDVNFENNINIIMDNSGTGKTYLFKILSDYFNVSGKPSISINYKDDINNVNNKLSSKEVRDENCVILYDNADLTLDSEIFYKLKECAATKIIIIKSRRNIHSGDVGFYKVIYNNATISTRKVL